MTNQLLHGGAGIDLVGTPTAAKVVVAAEDAVAAREFALDFDDRTQEQSTWSDEPTRDDITAWPTCPKCGAKRTTRCPICETSGTDFLEADRGFLGELAESAEGASAGSCGCSGSCSTKTGGDSQGSCSTGAAPSEHEEEEEEEDPETMLMCSVCDEPFEPTYPKHCEWCDHEF